MNLSKLAGIAILSAASALPTFGSAAVLTYSAALDGAQHEPAVMTGATGTATLRVDDVAETLSFQMDVQGIFLDDLWTTLVAAPVGPIHLHDGDPGMNGPVIVPFAFDNATYSQTATGFGLNVMDYAYADAAATSGTTLGFEDYIARLDEGGSYINIHTNDFNSGEIRGHLAAVPVQASVILLLSGLGLLSGARAVRHRSVA